MLELVGLALDMEVMAWSQNLTQARCEEIGAQLVTKNELFRNSDVLSIHVILSDRTRGLVGVTPPQGVLWCLAGDGKRLRILDSFS